MDPLGSALDTHLKLKAQLKTLSDEVPRMSHAHKHLQDNGIIGKFSILRDVWTRDSRPQAKIVLFPDSHECLGTRLKLQVTFKNQQLVY